MNFEEFLLKDGVWMASTVRPHCPAHDTHKGCRYILGGPSPTLPAASFVDLMGVEVSLGMQGDVKCSGTLYEWCRTRPGEGLIGRDLIPSSKAGLFLLGALERRWLEMNP
jgi:hypothetical protein